MASPDQPLEEAFDRDDGNFDGRLQWRCPPRSCIVADGQLLIETHAETDFWQRTHYGFSVDNGHLLSLPAVPGDFVLQTKVTFHHVHQYDQAGLMVRIDADNWLKTSVEHEPGGPNRLGAVVTNKGFSDWSTCDLPLEIDTVELRVRREGPDYMVEARYAGSLARGDGWSQLRMARLAAGSGQPVAAGLYACSPKGLGFKAAFHYLRLAPGRVQGLG